MTDWTTFHLKVVTPLFSGEDPTTVTDSPIRVPSIRGALRFWFRAVAAGHGITDLPALAAVESEVFGSTHSPSPIRLRINQQPIDGLCTDQQPLWTSHTEDGAFYGARYLLGQGLWRGGLTRPYVQPDAEFFLQVRFSGRPVVDNRFMLALWALLAYGGIGARTRRGFGRLSCEGLANPPDGWALALLRHDGSADELLGRWEQVIPDDVLDAAAGAFTTEFGDFAEPAAQLARFPSLSLSGWEGQAPWCGPFPLGTALDVAGRNWRAFRAAMMRGDALSNGSPEWTDTILGASNEYPVAAFGLPVNYFRPAKSPDERPTTATIDLVKGEKLRRASPVWIVPVPILGEGFAVFTHVLRAELGPDNARLARRGGAGSKDLPVPDENSLNQSWNAWLEGSHRPTS